jgi:hypothetical protein
MPDQNDVNNAIVDAMTNHVDKTTQLANSTSEFAQSTSHLNNMMAAHILTLYKMMTWVAFFIFLIFVYLFSSIIENIINATYQEVWVNTDRDMKLVVVAGGFVLLSVILAYPAQYLWKKFLKHDKKA